MRTFHVLCFCFAWLFAGGAAHAADWSKVSINEIGLAPVVVQNLTSTGVRTIEQLGLLRPFEINLLRTMDVAAPRQIHAYFMENQLKLDSSVFEGTCLNDRLALHRNLARTISDYFANEQFLRGQMLKSPPRDQWLLSLAAEERARPAAASALIKFRLVSLATIGLNKALVERLAEVGLNTVAEVLLASATELLASVRTNRKMLAPLYAYLAKNNLEMNQSAFLELPFDVRVRLHRFGVFNHADYFARADVLRTIFDLSSADAYAPTWARRQTRSAAGPFGSERPAMDTSVRNLGFSSRLSNTFLNEGALNLGEALLFEDGDLMRVANFGFKTLDELKRFYELHGLKRETEEFQHLRLADRLEHYRRWVAEKAAGPNACRLIAQLRDRALELEKLTRQSTVEWTEEQARELSEVVSTVTSVFKDCQDHLRTRKKTR